MVLVDASRIIMEPAVSGDLLSLVSKHKPRIEEIEHTVTLLREKGLQPNLLFISLNEIYNFVNHEHNGWTDAFEPAQESVVKELLELLKLEKHNLLCLLNDSIKPGEFKSYGYNEHAIPWFMYTTHHLHEYMNQDYNKQWNCSSKILFTPGKVHKWHRLFALLALEKAGLLNDNDTLWSSLVLDSLFLDKNDDTHPQQHQAMHHSSFCDDYLKFYNIARQYNRNLDVDLNLINQNNIDLHYTGFPYDSNIYRDTGFSIVCQTELGNSGGGYFPFLTEKVWRCVHNKHPFLLIGETKTIAKLNELGYKTFEWLYDPSGEFTEKFTYQNIFNGLGTPGGCDWFIDQLAEQILNFRNNIEKYKDEINLAVEHNFSLMIEQCKSLRVELEREFHLYRVNGSELRRVDVHLTLLDNSYRNPIKLNQLRQTESLYTPGLVLNQHPLTQLR